MISVLVKLSNLSQPLAPVTLMRYKWGLTEQEKTDWGLLPMCTTHNQTQV